jgi:hypothetical protein
VTYAVRSLSLGQARIRGPELFWMSDWDRWYPLQFQAILIRGHGLTALVNTGPPEDLESVHELLPEVEWAHPPGSPDRLRRAPGEQFGAALARHGLRPTDITHVLLTPLELYTTGCLNELRTAQICIAKRGWVHLHTTHSHPHDVRWRSMSHETLVDLVTDSWHRVRLLEDEDELAPGLRTWWAGGHHRATMVVEVDTNRGVVAVSDVFFRYENVEGGRLLGLNESVEEVLAANARVLRSADHIVPLHDPAVFERYAQGEIASAAGEVQQS